MPISLEPKEEKPLILSFHVYNKLPKLDLNKKWVGILGSQFLQCCRVDFRHNWLEIPSKGGVASLLKIPGMLIKP